ncbi:hypothetical protein KGF56_000956 [Candida oxycetoniae]|uniref:RecQ mediated genome instability protein 1 OB-fold domain-containing protein n=1 Tax=Candida oxycetoniae TaxID=497107 RepID=A0AAI9WZP6_9ASCO|nr:uncharacterized protein KGF56_000956 [Candida oxycetoniae]KAI3406115.2 hypothetical protein KGF56_000956 [Candida oxycetoniae]
MSLVASNYADVESAPLNNTVIFHILRVESISKSKLNQLDEWKELVDPNNASVDRIKKNRMIREVNMDVELNTASPTSSTTVYKLLLRDGSGNFVYAYEQEPLRFLRSENTGTPMPIKLGGRLVVKKGAQISRGVLLLNHKNCEYKETHTADAALVTTLNEGVAAREMEILSNQLLL